MQGTTRSGSGLHAHRVDQGSAAAVVGLDGGGDSGSGLLWGRQHRRVKARVTWTRGEEQGTCAAGPGHCTEMSQNRGSQ